MSYRESFPLFEGKEKIENYEQSVRWTFQDLFLFMLFLPFLYYYFIVLIFNLIFNFLSYLHRFFLGGHKEGAFVDTWHNFLGCGDVIGMTISTSSMSRCFEKTYIWNGSIHI